jgi:hypothetical protein
MPEQRDYRLNFDPSGMLAKNMRTNPTTTIRTALNNLIILPGIYESVMQAAKIYDITESEYPEEITGRQQAHWTGSALAINAVLSLDEEPGVAPIDIVKQFIVSPVDELLANSSTPSDNLLASKNILPRAA